MGGLITDMCHTLITMPRVSVHPGGYQYVSLDKCPLCVSIGETPSASGWV
ncbi:MAG: hypothetical protein J5641_02340 [Bacteroidales bacterium]|nr:hypothetical protein [Bacteroidales bacterium]